jgi:hypothetical protein
MSTSLLSQNGKAARSKHMPQPLECEAESQHLQQPEAVRQADCKPSSDGNQEVAFEFAEPAPPEEPSYAEWFYNTILKSRWTTYVVAFYLHWFALLSLSAIYLHMPEQLPPISLDAVFSDDLPLDDSLVAVVETDLLADTTDILLDNQLITSDVSALTASTLNESLPPALPDLMTGISAVAAAAVTAGKPVDPVPAMQPVNVPAHAVTSGSFSVWAEPANPEPGEPYKIVIQIRIPDGTEKYSMSDLEGVVVGSDGYQKLIPGAARGFLPIREGRVRMEVHVISEDQMVEDTVFVKSRLLREAQRLQIRF